MEYDIKKYPYFAYAALSELRDGASPQRAKSLRAVVAANNGHTPSVMEILGLNAESLVDFYPDNVPAQLSTSDTIDVFLAKFSPQEQPSMSSAAASMPYEPGSGTVGGEAISADRTSSAIDAFLNAVPAPTPRKGQPETAPHEAAANQGLTESFAAIMVKNGNYEKALAIFQDLNLKNPEKSIYFADQIRFLKKLIINQKHSRNQ